MIIFLPLLIPLGVEVGIDPIQFGAVVVLNLMIGLMHPPIGLLLFVVSSVEAAAGARRVGGTAVSRLGARGSGAHHRFPPITLGCRRLNSAVDAVCMILMMDGADGGPE